MMEFLQENASAIFALAGVFGGSLLSFWGTWLLKRRDLQLRLCEKVIDRRLASHDAVITLAKELRKTGILYDEATSFEDRAPICFCTPEDFDKFNTVFALTMVEHSTWLSASLVRELHLLQEYLVNVQIRIREVGKNKTFELGCIIREDFISFSSRIEQFAIEYFSKIQRLENLKYPTETYYSEKERKSRLAMTALSRKSDDIWAISKS